MNDGLVDVPNADGTRVEQSVNGPISFRGRAVRRTGPVPRLGEHEDARFGDA